MNKQITGVFLRLIPTLAHIMRNKNKWIFLILVSGIVLSGCANLNYGKPLVTSSRIPHDKAYIYGRFMLDRDFANMRKLALQIENIDTIRITSFVFSDTKPVFALAFEPGNYRLKGFSYAPLGAIMDMEVIKMDLPQEPRYLKDSIIISGGQCYYLGDFFGVSRRENVAAFIGSVLGTMAAASTLPGIKEEDISINNLNLQYGVVAITQEFELTTEELKKSLLKISQLPFHRAFE